MTLPIDLNELYFIAPCLILALGGFLLPLIGAMFSLDVQRSLSISVIVVLSILSIASCIAIGNVGYVFNMSMRIDLLSHVVSVLVILLLLISVYFVFSRPSSYGEHPSLVGSLLLFSASGALLMIASAHLLLIFVGLEILSIPLYVLTSLNIRSKRSAEGAFKYFLLGAIASAFFVFGMALLWGELDTLLLRELSGRIFALTEPGNLSIIGFALLLTALFFKLGLAPFHMWIPDVYETAPASLTAWMSGAVKLTVGVVILRLAEGAAMTSFSLNLVLILKVIAMLSMLWGSFGALLQSDLKRLLGYASVSHAGYILMALICAFQGAYDQVIPVFEFYFLTYGLASMVAFGVVLFAEETDQQMQIDDLRGLYGRNTGLAIALSISLLSMAGLPPLAGFFAKYQVFSLVISYGHVDLMVTAIMSSLISLGYYLRIIMIATEESPEAKSRVISRVGVIPAFVSVALLFLGVFPYGAVWIVNYLWK